MSLAIDLCIDGSCETMRLFENVKVPIPSCHTNMTSFQLPGDGTIQGFVRELGENIGDTAIDVVVEKLGATVSLFICAVNKYG